MKKIMMFFIVMALFCVTACGQGQSAAPTPTTAPTATIAPQQSQGNGQLTAEELSFFEEKFFTTETEYPGRWIRNNILYTEFTEPAKADLEAMLYNESGVEDISEEEYAFLKAQMGELFDVSKFTTAYINEMLQTYLGITLEESEKIGLDKLIYNAEYDAYYLVCSDALGVFVKLEEGYESESGVVTLIYRRSTEPLSNLTEAQIQELPRYLTALLKTENGYQYLLNQAIVE